MPAETGHPIFSTPLRLAPVAAVAQHPRRAPSNATLLTLLLAGSILAGIGLASAQTPPIGSGGPAIAAVPPSAPAPPAAQASTDSIIPQDTPLSQGCHHASINGQSECIQAERTLLAQMAQLRQEENDYEKMGGSIPFDRSNGATDAATKKAVVITHRHYALPDVGAIFGSGGALHATLIFNKDQPLIVHQGEYLPGGYRVYQIRPDQVILTHPGGGNSVLLMAGSGTHSVNEQNEGGAQSSFVPPAPQSFQIPAPAPTFALPQQSGGQSATPPGLPPATAPGATQPPS